MSSPSNHSSVVLFQLYGGMVSHIQVLARNFSTLHNTKCFSVTSFDTFFADLLTSFLIDGRYRWGLGKI